MSEINCNKLEITSFRQCDSIKIRGNIGPCIIEGPARQDSCQGCQPGCSYWIWPVTHIQISPVKITGYIDFLFLFESVCEHEYAVFCGSIFSTSLQRNVVALMCMCVCIQVSVCCTRAARKGCNSGTYTSGALQSASEAAQCVLIAAVGSCTGTLRQH